MTQSEAAEIVREVVTEVSGKTGFGDDACPIGGLGLESIDGVQVAVCLEVRLGIKIDDKLNPLVDDLHRRARSVSEAAAWLADYVNARHGGRCG